MKGIKGSLRTMSIQDVIQWLNMGVKTGTLVVQKEDAEYSIYFKDGIIIAASSKDPQYSLGQFLKREGLITERQIEKVRLIQDHTHEIFGSILLELGILDERDLLEGLKKQTEEIIFKIFDWNNGKFKFLDGEIPSNKFMPVSITAHNLIIEGTKRLDDWKRIRDIFTSNNIIIGLTEEGKNELLNLELPGLDSEVMSKINGRRSIGEIINLCGTGEYDIFKTLEKFYKLNQIELLGEKEVIEQPDKFQQIMNETNILKSQGYLDEAVMTLKKAFNEYPKNENLKQLLQEIEQELENTIKETIGDLNRIPVLMSSIDSTKVKVLNLKAEEGFLLSRIDNYSTIKQIMSISGMTKDQVYKGLYKFLKKELIGFQDQLVSARENRFNEPKTISEKVLRTIDNEFALEGVKRVMLPQDQMEIIMFFNKTKDADYFTMLNVKQDVSKDEIIESFKELVKKFYPAQYLEISPFFSMKLKVIIQLLSNAVDTLCSRRKRTEYLETLQTSKKK